MSQIPNENDENRSVAASDFVKLEQPDEVPDHEEQGRSQFGLNQSFDSTLDTGSTHNNNNNNNNYENVLKEQKLMIEKLEAKNQTLQKAMENLELKAEIRALKENGEQNAKYQALEAKVNEVVQMHSTQNEQHHKEMEQLKYGFEKEMTQVEAQNLKLEKKLKNCQQAIGSNLKKLDFMLSHLMANGKILANPKGIVWDGSKTDASISKCGLKLNIPFLGGIFATATEGYAISAAHCRKENCQFPGTIVFYFEVTKSNYEYFSFGFTDGNESKPTAGRVGVGGSPNSYGIEGCGAENGSLWLSGKEHKLRCPTGVIGGENVIGSGLLLNAKNELAVFFTLNGIVLGKQIRINPTVNRLYPTVCIYGASVEANFGDNPVAKPFKFDIGKCPGLVIE